MLAGQLLFTGVIFYLVYSKAILPTLVEYEKTIQVMAVVLSAATLFIGNSLFKKKLLLLQADTNTAAKEKLLTYRSMCMLQWGLAEAGILVCGICLLVTGNYAFLALAVVLIMYFALLVPDKNKIALQLNLSSAELDAL